MRRVGAHLLVEGLLSEAVTNIFSVSGNQVLPIFDAIQDHAGIRILHARHEAAAVHMADGWGRVTETPGVALLPAGPGHLNGVTGLFTSLHSESPVVMLSGASPLGKVGAFQALDQVGVATPLVKAAWTVQEAAHMKKDVIAALHLATSGRPGPVHLSLPMDLLDAEVGTVDGDGLQGESTSSSADLEEQAAAIGELLSAAQRPLILTGAAMSRLSRWSWVEDLTHRTGVPALQYDSPRGFNDPYLRDSTNRITEADVILLLGKGIDYTLQFGNGPCLSPNCRLIQVGLSEAHVSPCHNRVELTALPGDDMKTFLEAVATRFTTPHSSSSHWRDAVEGSRAPPAEWNPYREVRATHPLRVLETMDQILPHDTILAIDGGEFGQWTQAVLDRPLRFINGTSGCIGGMLPAAIAAKVAHPSRPVVAIMGDGCFGFHGMEFDTAVRHGVPVVAVVGNDARWNAEYQLQLNQYGEDRVHGCDLLPTAYHEVVKALGGAGYLVDRVEDLPGAFEAALGSGVPALINVMLDSAPAPVYR